MRDPVEGVAPRPLEEDGMSWRERFRKAWTIRGPELGEWPPPTPQNVTCEACGYNVPLPEGQDRNRCGRCGFVARQGEP